MVSKKIKMIAMLASFLTVTSIAFTNVKADGINTTRLGGQDRYETSSKISSEYIKSENNGAILALGEGFADALGGSVLAQKYKMPILLCGATTSDSQSALSFIKSNISTSKTIYVLGGNGGIKDDVVDTLKSQGYSNITRLGGSDRYDTNAKIVDNFNAVKGTPVVIANGENFPDALSISSIAAAKGYPILLTTTNIMSDNIEAKLKAIQPSKIYIAGGTASVSDANLNQIKSISNLSSSNVVRLGGADRYETSLAIAKYFSTTSDNTISFANGEGFADALSGSALSAQKGAPLLLVDSAHASEEKSFINNMKYSNAFVYGGIGSVTDSLLNSLIANNQPTPVQPTNDQQTYKLGNVDVTPDSGSTTNYVTEAWNTAHNVYDGKDITNPNYNKSKADMMIYTCESAQDNSKENQFVFKDGSIKLVDYPIAGNGFLEDFTESISSNSDQAKLLNAQFYSMLNRFLSQNSSNQKACLEQQGYIEGTNDLSSGRGISFSTDGEIDFFFATTFTKEWDNLPVDFKEHFNGCTEFLYMPYYIAPNETKKLDSLKSVLIGAFGDDHGPKIYDAIEKYINDSSIIQQYSTYNVDGITIICDSKNGTIGFK